MTSQVTLLDEEAAYALALRELNAGSAQPGLWAKAFSETDGDENRAKALYIRLRVQSLRNQSGGVGGASAPSDSVPDVPYSDQPVSPQNTEAPNLIQDASLPPQTPSKRTFLGPLTVVSMALLLFVITGAKSFGFGIGYTVGTFIISLAFALPIFIVVKYATTYGKRLDSVGGINLLCYILVGCWIVQIVLTVAVPSLVERFVASTREGSSFSNYDVPVERETRRGSSFSKYDKRVE